jgi:dTDP-4-dehydrorhamnose reductase
VRLPLMYGWGRGPAKGRNFAEKWLRALLTGGKVQAFTDQWRTPLYVEDAATALRLLLEKEAEGIVHVAGPDRVNRYELGLQLAKAFSLAPEAVIASSVNDTVYRDPRPADVSLSIEKLKTATGFTPLGMAAGIEEMHQDLLKQA